MDILSSIILGAVQGLTEFLPISSSGHLIIAREILGLNTSTGLLVEAVLHLATALVVLLYFRRDFVRLASALVMWAKGASVNRTDKNLILALLFGTVPAAV